MDPGMAPSSLEHSLSLLAKVEQVIGDATSRLLQVCPSLIQSQGQPVEQLAQFSGTAVFIRMTRLQLLSLFLGSVYVEQVGSLHKQLHCLLQWQRGDLNTQSHGAWHLQAGGKEHLPLLAGGQKRGQPFALFNIVPN